MKFCKYCGKELKDEAMFCSACGESCVETSTRYCSTCGTSVEEDARFCPSCGAACAEASTSKKQKNDDFDDSTLVMPKRTEEHLIDSVTGTINRLAGGKGAVRPPFRKIFGDIFVKHSRKDSEEIFICGTETTTSCLDDEAQAWPKPWFWTRILIAFGAAFLILHLCMDLFQAQNAVAGVMFIGSFMVPVALMMFFFEFNTPRNISFFTMIKIFLVGGCASLLATFVLHKFFPSVAANMDYKDAVIVGIVEELAKLIIVVYYAYRQKGPKYLTNGLLIGAAVGAGFAAFESAGYALNMGLLNNISSGYTVAYEFMVEKIIVLRALLAPGGHIAWAAVSGYAVIQAMGAGEKKENFLFKSVFWRLFWIPVLLHSVWDMPITFGQEFYFVPIVLTLMIWFILFILLGSALTQIGQILEAKRKAAETMAAEEASAETSVSEPVPVGASVNDGNP